MTIRPEGAVFFHVERQTDMTNVTVVIGNFANAPKSDA